LRPDRAAGRAAPAPPQTDTDCAPAGASVGARFLGLCRLCLAAAVAGIAAAPGFARTSEVERNLEAMIGRAAAEVMAHEYGTIDNPLLQKWVDAVGGRVAGPCPRRDLPVRFRVLDTPQSNAFSLPGAYIFVTRGLLASVRSDDELAGVLAHEVGHYADRDFQRTILRQLAYVGLQWGVERLDEEQWLTPIRVVQVLDSLRASREQEDDADERGVQYAFEARYDPEAMAGFYGPMPGARRRAKPWYQMMLETHPDALRRQSKCLARSRALEVAEPNQLAALAAGLAGRFRYAAALASYERLRELRPEDPALLLATARIHLLRGENGKCREACEQALRLAPGDTEATALLGEASAPPPPVPEALARPSAGGSPVPAPDPAAVAKFRALTRALVRNYPLEQALKWAQAIDVEGRDVGWLYLVAKARLLLMAVERLRWRLFEVSGMVTSAVAEWPEVAGAPNPPDMAQALTGYSEAVRAGCQAARRLDTAAGSLPPVMAALALTGAHDPLGRMSASRFALMQGDLLVVENHTRMALESCRTAAAAVAAAESARLALRIDSQFAPAAGRQRAIQIGLAGTRLGLTTNEVGTEIGLQGGLGAACRSAAQRRASEGRAGKGSTYQEAESVRIVLKLLAEEMREASAAGEGGSSPGVTDGGGKARE